MEVGISLAETHSEPIPMAMLALAQSQCFPILESWQNDLDPALHYSTLFPVAQTRESMTY